MRKMLVSTLSLLVGVIGFAEISAAQLSVSQAMRRARELRTGLSYQLEVLEGRLRDLPPNELRLRDKVNQIGWDMENTVQRYQKNMTLIIVDTADPRAQASLHLILEDDLISVKRRLGLARKIAQDKQANAVSEMR